MLAENYSCTNDLNSSCRDSWISLWLFFFCSDNQKRIHRGCSRFVARCTSCNVCERSVGVISIDITFQRATMLCSILSFCCPTSQILLGPFGSKNVSSLIYNLLRGTSFPTALHFWSRWFFGFSLCCIYSQQWRTLSPTWIIHWRC